MGWGWVRTVAPPVRLDIDTGNAVEMMGSDPTQEVPPQGRNGSLWAWRKWEVGATAPIEDICHRAFCILIAKAYSHLLTQWVNS
jgi:hypothetical protein